MPSRTSTCDAFALPTLAAVVCHDAGAAHIIIAGLRRSACIPFRACMQGPAGLAWERAFGGPAPCKTVADALEGATFLLSGTGWASDLEHEARTIALRLGVRSAAMLDHWVNYPQRFVRNNVQVLPDELWVTDIDAENIARQAFPGIPIKLTENWYVEEQLQRISDPIAGLSPILLYLAEPARSNWGRSTPGEFQALDYFLVQFPTLNLPANLQILLRPHPSDPPGKYDSWIRTHPSFNVELDTSPSVATAISRAHWVAGCESFALTLALRAGRTVYCSLPPWAPRCRLPQKGLIHIATPNG